MDASRHNDGSNEGQSQGFRIGSHSEDPSANEDAIAQEGWRRVAELIQGETDPAKLFDLVEQLIAEFDRSQSLDSSQAVVPLDSASGCTSEGQQEDGLRHGGHDRSTGPTR